MKTILIVDDAKNIRNLLKTCLELEGYNLLCASNADEALEILSKKPIDLAFIDIKLPGMSGTELLRQIRKKEIKCMVIIMTAFATIKNAVECTRLGAAEYIQKPFTASRVKSILTQINF